MRWSSMNWSMVPWENEEIAHTYPVSESFNLHNTLHYLSSDALHAALSSVRLFEVTRSSDHLTYFIKNTWDTTQTGSLFLSLLSRLASQLQHSSVKHPDGQQLPHFIHLCSGPFPHLSLHVTDEINTSLHSETCVHILNICLHQLSHKWGRIDKKRHFSSRNAKHLLVLVCQMWRFAVFYILVNWIPLGFGQLVASNKDLGNYEENYSLVFGIFEIWIISCSVTEISLSTTHVYFKATHLLACPCACTETNPSSAITRNPEFQQCSQTLSNGSQCHRSNPRRRSARWGNSRQHQGLEDFHLQLPPGI